MVKMQSPVQSHVKVGRACAVSLPGTHPSFFVLFCHGSSFIFPFTPEVDYWCALMAGLCSASLCKHFLKAQIAAVDLLQIKVLCVNYLVL